MYKPLPDGITIKESKVQGLGLYATKDFKADTVFGIVHIKNKITVCIYISYEMYSLLIRVKIKKKYFG